QKLSRRSYASAAAATAEAPPPPSQHQVPPVVQAVAPKKVYKIQTGVVLSRPPQITRDLHTFEKAFFLYQRRLNERLALPFTRYHYFTRGTPAYKEWYRKFKLRETPAHEIGVYNAYGKEGWNDELLVGAVEADTQHQVDVMLEEAKVPKTSESSEGSAAEEEVIERPVPRVTEADQKGDLKSLDRLLQMSLYLLVQNPDGRWTFPTAAVVGKEGLADTAERILVQTGGPNMNTWVVGNAPIGHYEFSFSKPNFNEQLGFEELGEKAFFMKARIMAGQVDLSANKLGLKDFRWSSSEEIEKLVKPKYWNSIRRMLPRR
ncbi:hypothetical protein NA57DRAFT_27912, partial [Rhizodiscina lignyota]